MLTQLSLSNFKSWLNLHQMRLAPLTGLFGANSSGKSSILQWLLLLKQTVNSLETEQALNLDRVSTLADLGEYEDIVHKKHPAWPLKWEISWQNQHPYTFRDNPDGAAGLPVNDHATIKSELWLANQKKLQTHKLEYLIHDRRYSCNAVELGIEPTSEFEYHYAATDTNNKDTTLERPVGRPHKSQSNTKCYAFPYAFFHNYTDTSLVRDVQISFEYIFREMSYLGPLRAFPERFYTISPSSGHKDVGVHGENTIALLWNSLGSLTTQSKRFPEKKDLLSVVSSWMRELTLSYSFGISRISEDVPLYRTQLQQSTDEDAPWVTLADVGFGVSQALPVITLCYSAPVGSTIILEQPEIHLHPAVQSKLADVLIDAALSRNIQIIFESHSEHLLRRIQRRIAERLQPCLTPNDVSLNFCKHDGSQSRLVPLEVDGYGNISNWPEDFFGDQFDEIAKMRMAALKRRSDDKDDHD